MARIPETEVQRLKDEVSVQRLVEAAGIELRKVGKDIAGRCPFHEDSEPSLIVTPAKNLWHCFGCGVGGGPIDWVMKLKGVSFRHAVELLKEDSSLAAPTTGSGQAIKRSTVRALAPPVALDADDQALLVQVVDYYHQTLRDSPEALAYLAQRGLDHPELIEHFKLGYANRSLGLRLPNKQRMAGADIRSRLERVGLYRASGHEHLAGSLVIPVLDEDGAVRELYGRKITARLRPGTPLHLYLPTHEERASQAGRGVFNVAALAASKEIILCEALIDALTFWCAGYRNVTSAYGIEGFTEEMLQAFKQHGVQRVLIAYDRDEAGERGAMKLAERLTHEGIECFRIQFPKGMDANEYALKVTPATKSLGLLIRKALWLGKGQAPALTTTPPTAAARGAAPMRPSGEPMIEAAKETSPELIDNPPVLPSLAADAALIEPLPASPMPANARELPVEIKDAEHGREVTLTLGEGKDARRWRVRGLAKNLAVDVLKVNLMVTTAGDGGEAFHVDTLDLYSAKARAHYVAQAAQETKSHERILKADLGRVLLALEQLQDQNIAAVLAPEPQPRMTDAEQEAALALLKSPDLIERILSDLKTCGLVGEETNKLVGYLAAASRMLDKPLGVVIQSSSAAGKTSLMDAVLAFVPEEQKVKYSAMTGQSLFYMGQTNLKHKALAIVEEEGAQRASYALKLLQSEGELTIASTGKDPASGNLVTQQYRVEGPVALLFTTTAREIDEELMNRCLVLAVDEGREQTRAIHERQRARRTLDGLFANRERQALTALHQNAQRLLRPLEVLNPYAQWLTFPDQTTRLRRDHEKYLTLIDVIAFVHQHQRRVLSAEREGRRVEYIEATLADIERANAIAHDVLGRSLDELPAQTRRLLALIDGHVRAESGRQALRRCDVRFTRRALREAISWGDTQTKTHLARLVDLEYLVAHRTKSGGFEYELVYEIGADEGARLPGLADIEAIKKAQAGHAYDAARAGQNDHRSAPGRGLVGPWSAPGRGDGSPAKPASMRVAAVDANDDMQTHCSAPMRKPASYAQPIALAAGA